MYIEDFSEAEQAEYNEYLDEVAAASQVDIDHEQYVYELVETAKMLAGGNYDQR
jgi:hypothetical protein